MAKPQRTVRVELALTDEQRSDLEATLDLYRAAWSSHAAWFVANKTVNGYQAHAQLYPALRKRYPTLPSALLQSTREGARESLKAWNARNVRHKWSKTPTFRARSMRCTARSISLRGNLLTFSTVGKRARVLVTLPAWFRERYPDWIFQAGSVGIDRHGRAFAQLTYRSPDESPASRTTGKVVGLDRGIKNVVFTSEGQAFTGKRLRAQRRRWLYNRATLAAKSTRSAKRRLRAMSGREARYGRWVNHSISKALAGRKDVAVFVLEDLGSLAKRGQRSQGKQAKYRKRRAKRLSDWSHAQLLEFLAYKCEAEGIRLELVNPAYTSQDCSQCGHRDPSARRGGRFACVSPQCGWTGHADYNAALNVRDRYLSSAKQPKQGVVKRPYAQASA